MRGIKIPLQDLALKLQGGAYLRYIHCDYGYGFCVIAPVYVLAAIMSSELCGRASALTGRVWERG